MTGRAKGPEKKEAQKNLTRESLKRDAKPRSRKATRPNRPGASPNQAIASKELLKPEYQEDTTGQLRG